MFSRQYGQSEHEENYDLLIFCLLYSHLIFQHAKFIVTTETYLMVLI